jgi:hypothetical protein
MFDRSACARARIATDAHADLAALTTPATLPRHALNDHFASSNAPVSGASRLSRDQNRGEVYATPDKADNGAPPRAATNRPVRRRTADDDRWHAGMVRAADGDPSSADQPDDTVDPGACRQAFRPIHGPFDSTPIVFVRIASNKPPLTPGSGLGRTKFGRGC